MRKERYIERLPKKRIKEELEPTMKLTSNKCPIGKQ
jgi:hypothetical protein